MKTKYLRNIFFPKPDGHKHSLCFFAGLLMALLLGAHSLHAQNLLTESFDGAAMPPAGWTSVINGGAYNWVRETANNGNPSIPTHSGAGMAVYQSYSVQVGGAELRTPALNFTTPTGVNEVRFWMYRDNGYQGYTDRVEVYVNTTASATGGTLLGTVNRNISMPPAVQADGWYEYNFNVPTTFNTATNYIIFKAISNYGNDMFVDDIKVNHVPPCAGLPTPGTVVGTPAAVCSGSTSSLTITGTSIASGLAYQWQDSVAPGTWTNISGATTSSYTTAGLTAPHSYRAKVICSATNDTAYTTAKTILVNNASLPYFEDFESIPADDQLPNCMTATNFGNSTGTLTYSPGYGQENHTPGGSKMGYFVWNNSPDAFFTPALTLQGGSTYRLTYWFVTDGYNGWNSLDAYYGTSPTLAAMTNLIVTTQPGTTTTYTQVTGNFTPATTGVYYIGIQSTHSTSPNYMSIDDIGLVLLPPCSGTPTAGTVAGPAAVCLNTSANLTLSGSAIASSLSYQWQDSVSPGVWTNIAGATLDAYTTAPLTATRYFRAKVICNNTNDTSYTPAKQVTINTSTVPYFEDFESIQMDNQLPNCMTATNFNTSTFTGTISSGTGQVNHTPGGSKFGYYQYNSAQDAFITPALTLQAGNTYKFSYWYVTDGFTGWTSIDAYFGTSPTIAGLSNFIGSVNPGTSTTYQQFVGTFTPATTGVYYVGIVSTHTTSPLWMSIDDIGLIALPPCSGKPVAGTIVPTTPCPGQTFSLSLNGGTDPATTGGLTFQWEDSSSLGWAASVGPTATQPVFTTSITTPTTYRVIVTCNSPGGSSDTSASYRVNVATFLYCYCIPTYPSGGTTDNITNVVLRNMANNTSGAGNAFPNWHDYASLQPSPVAIPLLTMGQTDTVKVTFGTDGTQYSMIWIDFDHNGSFDATEAFTTGTTPGGGGTVKIPFTTPLNAMAGLTKLRVRGGDDQALSNSQACYLSNSNYGEGEDYLVNITYPPCTGPVDAGTAIASEYSICRGYTIDIADTTHDNQNSLISWSWQSSTDNGLTWNALANSANKDTLNNILITGPVSFRLKMVCDVTGDSSFSSPAAITIKPPYACYCYSQSNGGTADSADIGAVVIGDMINATGGPHVSNPIATRRRTDYTSIPNIVMYANNAYHLSIYHIQRNSTHTDARVSVFIDYNNDLVYNANALPNSERVYTGISTESNFYIDTMIHVPDAVVPNAPTGLRVILNNDLDPNSPANLGCGPYVSGETEDYVVEFRRVPQGVNGITNMEAVTLYPNPTSGRFTIVAQAAKSMERVEVSVLTVSGQLIMKKSYGNIGNKFTGELDLTEAAKGFYFVEVKTANGDKMVRKLSIK